MRWRDTFRGMNGRNGNGAARTKRNGRAKPSKARLAAMDRVLRDAEKRTGVKVSKAEVDAVMAELDALTRG